MKIQSIADAQIKAQVFLRAAKAYVDRKANDKDAEFGCKESGALRRASLDLTRALAEMRKP